MSETVTMTLVDFLTARLVDDTALARQMQAEYVTVHGGPATVEEPVGSQWWLAARVLREVEAKRSLVLEYETQQARCDTLASQGVREDSLAGAANMGLAAGYLVAVEALAMVYSDHPDYRQEWRP